MWYIHCTFYTRYNCPFNFRLPLRVHSNTQQHRRWYTYSNTANSVAVSGCWISAIPLNVLNESQMYRHLEITWMFLCRYVYRAATILKESLVQVMECFSLSVLSHIKLNICTSQCSYTHRMQKRIACGQVGSCFLKCFGTVAVFYLPFFWSCRHIAFAAVGLRKNPVEKAMQLSLSRTHTRLVSFHSGFERLRVTKCTARCYEKGANVSSRLHSLHIHPKVTWCVFSNMFLLFR